MTVAGLGVAVLRARVEAVAGDEEDEEEVRASLESAATTV